MLFGADSTAQQDFERMEAVNREVGLDSVLGGGVGSSLGDGKTTGVSEKEKMNGDRDSE